MSVLIQARRVHVSIVIIAVIVGFLLVTQLRVQRATSHLLQAQTEQDLGQIVRQLNFETDVLQAEVSKLRFKLFDYEAKAEDKRAILVEAEENLKNLKITSGLLAIEGPGIKVRISDKENILSSPDFLDLIQELKVAGAEGISVNNRRLSAQTYFKKKKHVFMDGKRISSPYEIRAIGNQEVLYQSVTLAGGIKDRLDSLDGVALEVAKRANVELPSLSGRADRP